MKTNTNNLHKLKLIIGYVGYIVKMEPFQNFSLLNNPIMKNKIYFLFLFLFSFSLFTKSQTVERLIDLGGEERLYGVATTNDGGLIIGGWRLDLNPVPGEDTAQAILIRTDIDGAHLWEKYEVDVDVQYSKIVELMHLSTGGIITATFHSFSGSNSDFSIRKLDNAGNTEWEQYNPSGLASYYPKILETPDEKILIISYIGSSAKEFRLEKRDLNGDLVWEKIIEGDSTFAFIPNDAIVNSDGEIIIIGSVRFGTYTNVDNILILKLDKDGNELWQNRYDYPDHQRVVKIKPTSDNGFILVGNTNQFNMGLQSVDALIVKLNENGELQWSKTYGGNDYDSFNSVLVDSGEGIIAVGSTKSFGNGDEDAYVLKIDSLGNPTFAKRYGNAIKDEIFHEIIKSSNGRFHILGDSKEEIGNSGYYKSDIYLVETNSLGITFNNLIKGNVFNDLDSNCIFDATDPTLTGRLVSISGFDYFETKLVDSNGFYQFTVDTGEYDIVTTHPYYYWGYCENPTQINIPFPNDTMINDMGSFVEVECPFLITDISTNFIRRCFENTYYVNYCNNGTISADSPYIEITLDTFLNFLNSSLPLTNQNGNIFTFDLDTIGIGECGQFTIEVEVDCDAPLGMTHCVEAHIYPDSLCLPTPSWSGGSVEVNGICVNDTIHFSIKNDGNSTLSQGLEYIVIEDDVILYSGDIEQLIAGGVQEVSIENIGATYRLEANQEPNHPGNSMPAFVIEGCGQGFTPGFVNQFPMDDADPFLDIDCRENIGSYDPNDKQAFPTGYDNEHYIEQNIDIEYLIRFQNTGTDTAFRVVIRDTLSPFLDVTSVRPGASSRPYEFDISGPGILKFTFNNILLPDSTANEPASHGFVKYRISQKENIPLGSVINNRAAIYFDFNAPVITNTTFHKVGEDFIPIYVSVNTLGNPAVVANVFPNPFSKNAIIELNGIDIPGKKTFSLFNSNGQLVQEFIFENNRFEINGAELNNGVYYFKIKNEEEEMAAGKLVVVK